MPEKDAPSQWGRETGPLMRSAPIERQSCSMAASRDVGFLHQAKCAGSNVGWIPLARLACLHVSQTSLVLGPGVGGTANADPIASMCLQGVLSCKADAPSPRTPHNHAPETGAHAQRF